MFALTKGVGWRFVPRVSGFWQKKKKKLGRISVLSFECLPGHLYEF